ncbi:MAG TPA: hypothetical protein VEC01_12635 [Noviherbaspirillum sp.]|uniref:hypothetical protein n=1 Tax=Noviherbaspirillum sp. TaxID=1926288 RepID=UPI002D240BEF|nr:hypothetical protein [Noviherbaspirillum sp.]HYD96166.1 hypothetical protein [Noviherbaspirillum sp.]
MTTLTIKDLAVATDLDASAMTAVRGGTSYKGTLPGWMSSLGFGEAKFDVSQMIGQSQNVVNNNGNNVAFASGITSTVNPTQSAHNNIRF